MHHKSARRFTLLSIHGQLIARLCVNIYYANDMNITISFTKAIEMSVHWEVEAFHKFMTRDQDEAQIN